MANKIKGLTIKIGADTVGLNDALKDISKKSRSTVQEIGEIDRAIKNTGGSAELWQQKQKLLNTAIEESKKKLELLEGAQEQLQEKLRIKEISEEQYRAFQRETEYARSAVKKYEDQLEKANDELRNMGSASDDAEKELDDLGDAAENTGKGGISALTVALGTLIADGIRASASALKDFTGDVVNTGMTFESSMSGVAAISGASAGDLERLSEKAKEMGATTKYTAAQSADAFGYMALAGWKTEEMLAGIDGVLSLAAASDMDLATASDIVTDYLTAFGLTAQDSARFVDMMSYAMANSNTTTELLGEAYKNCAATAASMGYSVEDTTAVLMTMANAGVKGGEAGTALNAIMTRLATDTKNCATELANYGVQVYDSEGNMQSLSSILEGVSGVWENLTDQEQANMAKIIAGTNHYSALQTIMNGLSDSAEEAGMSFGDYSAALSECDGTAQGMADTMQDNLSGDLTVLSSAVDGMKLSLADELNPVLREGVQYLTSKVPDAQKVLKDVFEVGAKGLKGAIDLIPKAKSLVTEKLMPAAKPAVDLIKKGTDMLPTFWNVVKQRGAPAVSLLAEVMKNTAAVAGTLFDILGKTVGVIAGLTGVTDELRELKMQKIFDDATKSANDLAESIQKDSDKMTDLKKTASEQVVTDLADVYKTQNLYDQLQNLVDENGKVKSGYEDRVKYITEELSQATGIEIELVDGQIQKYQELQTAIEDTIRKQRAQVFQGAYADTYSEALLQNRNKAAEYMQNEDIVTENQQLIDDIYRRTRQKVEDAHKSWADFGEFDPRNLGDWEQWVGQADLTRLSAAVQNIDTAQESNRQIDRQIQQNNYVIEQYEKAEEAFYNERYTLAERYYGSIDDFDRNMLDTSEKNNTELLNDFKAKSGEAIRQYETEQKKGIKGVESSAYESINNMAQKLVSEGVSGAELAKTGIVNKLSEIDGFDTQALKDFMELTGIELGDILANCAVDALGNAMLSSEVYDIAVNSFNSINSAADAAYYKSGDYIPHNAVGGYINQRGIVAEAGPELLEIINGGIRVTPLTDSARNTIISPEQNGGSTVITNYITAQVSGGYDVYKLAEDLANAEKIIYNGKGLRK